MPKLWIPEIGEAFVLAEPWSFTLHNEYRNTDVRDALGVTDTIEYQALEELEKEDDWQIRGDARRKLSQMTWPVTLPAGTKLVLDRIYIRKGASDYSSLSFYITDCPDKRLESAKKGGGFKKGRRRFWAKLTDTNNIVYESAA